MNEQTENMIEESEPKSLTRFLPVLILVSGLALAFYFDLHHYFSLSALKEHREFLEGFTQDNFILSIIIFMSVYALVVAFSLPGGAIMTITGGFLFGTLVGGSATVIGATLGATAIFLAARTALGDGLKKHAGPWVNRMEDGFKENAVSYMLVLRLVPIFPFFAVNLAPAFLGVSTKVYILTTLLGIIPGTFVYTSVGNGLGHLLDSGQDPDLGIIFSPEILGPILGLAILAMIPVLYKKFKKS